MIAQNSISATRGSRYGRDALRGHVWAGAMIATLPFSHAAFATATRPGAMDAPCTQNESVSAQWWLDLSVAPLARVPAGQRKAQLRAIQQEQANVERDIARLGLVASGRVTHLRNALAVTATYSQVQALRVVPGVTAVRPVNHNNRINTPQSRGAPSTGCS